jgi:hypothetical protein
MSCCRMFPNNAFQTVGHIERQKPQNECSGLSGFPSGALRMAADHGESTQRQDQHRLSFLLKLDPGEENPAGLYCLFSQYNLGLVA